MINKKYQILIIISSIILLTSTFIPPISVYAEDGDNDYGYGYNGANNSSQDNLYGDQQQGNQLGQDMTGYQGDNQPGGNHQSGSNNQNDSESGKQWRHQYRYRYQNCTMNMDCKVNQTRIRTKYRQNNTEETFEFLLNIDNVPKLTLSFIPNLNATIYQPHFNLSIEKIIEYYDTNNNGRYNKNDLIASSLSLSDMNFSNLSYTNTTSPEGFIISTIETHTLDNLFTLTIYVATSETSLYNNIITPEELKIDFIITNYSFTNQTTQLALITKLETQNRYNLERQTTDEQRKTAINECGINISSQYHRGFFSWSNQVNVDNKDFQVNVTIFSEIGLSDTSDSEESTTQTEIIFSYPQGTKITHDPKIGVNLLASIIPSIITSEITISELINLISTYAVCCAIAAILFIGVIYLRKKR